jgi:hypothetical protein
MRTPGRHNFPRSPVPTSYPSSQFHFGSPRAVCAKGTHPSLIPEKLPFFFSSTYGNPFCNPLCFQIHAGMGGYTLPRQELSLARHFARPLFSYAYKLQISQLLSFHIHGNWWGVYPLRRCCVVKNDILGAAAARRRLHYPSSQIAGKGRRRGRWILRLAFGAGLVGVSLWGIRACRELFGHSMVPGDSAIDLSYQGLAAGAAWFVFFAPLAAAGVALLWSTLWKMGAFALAAEWFARLAEPGRASPAHEKQGGASAGRAEADPHGLESLSALEVTRLERLARRIVVLLGSTVGSLLAGVGIFGLGYLWLSSRTHSGSAISGTLGAA